MRLHYQVTDALDGVDGPHVVDVSDYPDIRDLNLAADVLVTDYASVQFDFAVTGKPILYFAYDLDHYRTDLRKLYFDFERIAPGPMLSSVDELVEALGDLGRVTDEYRDRYGRFCSREDGHATQRVLDLVVPEPADRPGYAG